MPREQRCCPLHHSEISQQLQCRKFDFQTGKLWDSLLNIPELMWKAKNLNTPQWNHWHTASCCLQDERGRMIWSWTVIEEVQESLYVFVISWSSTFLLHSVYGKVALKTLWIKLEFSKCFDQRLEQTGGDSDHVPVPSHHRYRFMEGNLRLFDGSQTETYESKI